MVSCSLSLSLSVLLRPGCIWKSFLVTKSAPVSWVSALDRQNWSPRPQDNIIDNRKMISSLIKCFAEIKWCSDVMQWSRPQSLLELESKIRIFLVIDSRGGTCSGTIKLGQMTDRAEVGDIISHCQPEPARAPHSHWKTILYFFEGPGVKGGTRGEI